jgi:hypothetical protein
MPSRDAGLAMIEREFHSEAVHLMDRQATLSQKPLTGRWMTSLREFLHRSHVFFQYNDVNGPERGMPSSSIMGYCVPGSEDEVEEELARQDKRSLRDIT